MEATSEATPGGCGQFCDSQLPRFFLVATDICTELGGRLLQIKLMVFDVIANRQCQSRGLC